jgi:hypothetical protein
VLKTPRETINVVWKLTRNSPDANHNLAILLEKRGDPQGLLGHLNAYRRPPHLMLAPFRLPPHLRF